MVWFFLKLVAFLFTYVWFRATLPRLRYDQLMDLGWKKLIPAALYWLLLVGALRAGRDRGWNQALVLGVSLAVGVLCWAVLAGALRVGERETEETAEGEEVLVRGEATA